MSESKAPTQEDAEELYSLAIERGKEHLQPEGGEPIVNKDGEIVGRKLNPQVLRFALAVAEKENVRAIVRPGSAAATFLSEATKTDELDGLNFEFEDNPIVKN